MRLKSESTSFPNGGQAGLAIIFITFQEPDQCELNTNTVTLRLSSSNDLKKKKVFRVIFFECMEIFVEVNLSRYFNLISEATWQCAKKNVIKHRSTKKRQNINCSTLPRIGQVWIKPHIYAWRVRNTFFKAIQLIY
jgi:hypothetical protein